MLQTERESPSIAQHGPGRVLAVAAGLFVVGLVVMQVAPGAPGVEVVVVHIGGVVVGVGDGEFDADFAGQALGRGVASRGVRPDCARPWHLL